MSNVYVNKVVVNNVTKLDLSSDTITADKILKGYTAHDKSGTPIVGTLDMDEYLSTNFRGLYRGKNLGTGTTFATASTTAQRAAIANGTFTDLFIGDYWVIDNVVYRIADVNYWLNTGDTKCTTNHLVLVTDAGFSSRKMNSSATAAGAYVGSDQYSSSGSTLNSIKTNIASLFDSYLLTHREYLSNGISTDGFENSGDFYDSTVELMTEAMIKGYNQYKASVLGSTSDTQLALFRINQSLTALKSDYWLRDVASSTDFVYVENTGKIGSNPANTNKMFRLVFGIKGSA